MRERKLNRRQFLRLSASAAAGAILAGCRQAATPQVVEKEVVVEKVVKETVVVEKEVKAAPVRDPYNLPNAATGVPYEIKPTINDGKPIHLDYWEWALDRADYEKEWAQEYMNIYPNVTIEVTNVGGGEYWPKLAMNIPAGQGPDIYHMHTSRQTEFCAGLMEPMLDHVADQDFLTKHWIGYAEGAFDCPGGKRYYIPMGAQMPVLFINRAMWDEAGLTDNDVPKSWDDLWEVAKTLTKHDSAGRIVQAGFVPSLGIFLWNMIWQQGRYLFTADRQHAQVDNPEVRKAMEFIQKLYGPDGVTDINFPTWLEAFSSEQAAMCLVESWYVSVVRRNNPDLEWFAALQPTYTGTLEPTVGRMHFAVEAVVNPYAPPERKAVAWDFWHFLYSDDDRVVRTIALRNGMLPAYKKLLDHPAVKDDEVAKVLAPGVEYGIIIGEVPAVYGQALQNFLIDPVLQGAMSIEDAMKAAQAEADTQLAQRSDWAILERGYPHDNLMIPDQP